MSKNAQKNALLKKREEFKKREELRKQEELKKRKKRKRIILFSSLIAVVVISLSIALPLIFGGGGSAHADCCDGCSGKVAVSECHCHGKCGNKKCKCHDEHDH